MERPKRTYFPTGSTSTISKKQRNDSTNSKASITILEDLSNELIYQIFDYMVYTRIFVTFSLLNKRFSTLTEYYPSPMIVGRIGVADDVFEIECYVVIIPQQHRIRSLHLVGNTHIDTFFSKCRIDSSFICLESVTLEYIRPSAILSILSHLQQLPSLYRLSLNYNIIWRESLDIETVYQMLLNFKSLKYLKFSTTDPAPEETFYIAESSISNQGPSNLEYLVVDHLIDIDEILSIIQYTPKLRHLFLKSLEQPNTSSTIPKLPQLTKLIIQASTFNVEDLESLLNAFDCRLKTLKIATCSYLSFSINEQWKKLMNTTLSDLDIFKIDFDKVVWSDMFDDDDEDDEAENNCRIQSSIDFVCDPFWYDRGWMAQISVSTTSVQSLFRHSKSFNAVANHQLKNQLQKSIHFNNQHHHFNWTLLSSSFSLTLVDDYLENIWKDHFSNSKANISYLPIKQLTIHCSYLFILDLIMILKELPHVTYLNIDSKSILQIEDEKNEDTNEENRFNNIDQLEINAKLPWEGVICLMKYFPTLLDLHVYCECQGQVFDAIRGSFPLNELTGA